MIPPFIDEDAPSGERAVFNMLSGGPDDWTVIHSLDLAPWNNRRRTEVDFVVIIPSTGILCLEVKSHDRIECIDGVWSPPSIRKSPFKQALDARYSLHRGLGSLAGYTRSVPIAACCIFPNARFPLHRNLSVASRELMDLAAFRAHASAKDFCADLQQRLEESITAEGTNPLSEPLPPARVDNLVALSLPVQRRRPDRAEEIRQRRRSLEDLLRGQQRPVLRLVAQNQRVIVTGGAGTGKTLIAMEIALRASEEGLRVALVCFNRLVARWMGARLSESGPLPNLSVATVSGLLVELADVAVPTNPDDHYWTEVVPALVADRMTSPDFATDTRFDLLIVDEAQDVLARPNLWECLLSLLEGGLAGGRWALFGDLEHQVLKGRAVVEDSFTNLIGGPAATRWHLEENCRNPRPIGEAALLLSGLPSSIYAGYLRTGGTSADVILRPCASKAAALQAAQNILRDVQGRGFKPKDIVFLSFAAPGGSLADALMRQGVQLQPAGPHPSRASFASVHAFKGMESPIVIVTDTTVARDHLDRTLFYTALTRATEQVFVLCPLEDVPTLREWIKGADV